MDASENLRSLRDALGVSPDNVPLRAHLASTLLRAGQASEAEAEYRRALQGAPNDAELELGLARAFYAQGKMDEASLLIDALADQAPTPPALLLAARLCARDGRSSRALDFYRRAVAGDATLADPALEETLGIGALARASEIVERKERVAASSPEHERGVFDVPLERPTIGFADVGGMDAVKEEIRSKIVFPLQNAALYASYGKSAGGGILLYGPPGCGKTYLARATAGEVNASFASIGIHDVLDMWLGNSERNMHDLFAQARRAAPAVLFFDEVDALAGKRTDMGASAGRNTVNVLLAEMDGAQNSNDGVIVLAATNAPWSIDSAFRRPGRFDRVIFVPPPDAPARAAILRVLLRGKPQEALDVDAVAKKTDTCSGADLKGLVDVAVERKLRDAVASGVPKPLVTKDLLDAARDVKPTTREWFATARNYVLYANQGGVYDDVAAYLDRMA